MTPLETPLAALGLTAVLALAVASYLDRPMGRILVVGWRRQDAGPVLVGLLPGGAGRHPARRPVILRPDLAGPAVW